MFFQIVFLLDKDTCLITTFYSQFFSLSSDLQKQAGRERVNTKGLKGKLFNNSSKIQAIFDIWVNVHYVPYAFQMFATSTQIKKTDTHSHRLKLPSSNLLHMVPT